MSEKEQVQAAKRIYGSIDSCWLVSPTNDDTVVLDGDSFTAEQLEAIAYLLRHEPAALTERALGDGV